MKHSPNRCPVIRVETIHRWRILCLLLPCLYAPVLNASLKDEAQVTVEGRTLPAVGINAGWQDFSVLSTSIPFTNVMKVGTPWQGYDGETDENGYPLEIPEGREVMTQIFSQSQRHYPLGDYTLMWEGSGHIQVRTAGKRFVFTSGDKKVQTLSIEEASDYGIQLILSMVPRDDPIRNIRLYLPGYGPEDGIWTREYIADSEPFGLFRFCWGSGVWSFTEIENWEDRRHLGYHHWIEGDLEFGIPYEAMIELANRSGNDLWICVPHRANDTFIRNLAILVRDNLDPELRFWLEYTNEHWLDIEIFKIPPNDYFQEVIARNADDPGYMGMTVPRLYALMAMNVFEIFTEVFEETGEMDRLVRVLSGHTTDAHILEEATSEFVRFDKMDLVDALAVGPYFRNGEEEVDHFLPALDQGWEAIFESVHRTVQEMFDPTTQVGSGLHANAELAVKYGKPLVAYEAGQHYTTWTNTPAGIIAPMNRRPEMYGVYQAFLDGWFSLPNASTITLFLLSSLYNNEEAFGLREYYDQPESELHKRRAALDWIEEHRK